MSYIALFFGALFIVGFVSTMMNKGRCTKDLNLRQTILLHCGGIGFIGLVLIAIFIVVRIIISLA
ncbi:MAG: hypothetical protein FJ368_03155 [Pelagibacterales bacterium]|nr:hypothetical protein [Pelagibacterales bacterium]